MNEWSKYPAEGQAALVAIKSYYEFHGFSPGTSYRMEKDHYVTELAHFHNGQWCLDNSLRKPEVVAWMPVPQLTKEKEYQK